MLSSMKRGNLAKAYAATFLKNLQFFGPIAVPYFLDWLKVDYTRIFILQPGSSSGCLCWKSRPAWLRTSSAERSRWLPAVFCSAPICSFSASAIPTCFCSSRIPGRGRHDPDIGAEQALLYDLLIVLKEEERARFYSHAMKPPGRSASSSRSR